MHFYYYVQIDTHCKYFITIIKAFFFFRKTNRQTLRSCTNNLMIGYLKTNNQQNLLQILDTLF